MVLENDDGGLEAGKRLPWFVKLRKSITDFLAEKHVEMLMRFLLDVLYVTIGGVLATRGLYGILCAAGIGAALLLIVYVIVSTNRRALVALYILRYPVSHYLRGRLTYQRLKSLRHFVQFQLEECLQEREMFDNRLGEQVFNELWIIHHRMKMMEWIAAARGLSQGNTQINSGVRLKALDLLYENRGNRAKWIPEEPEATFASVSDDINSGREVREKAVSLLEKVRDERRSSTDQ